MINKNITKYGGSSSETTTNRPKQPQLTTTEPTNAGKTPYQGSSQPTSFAPADPFYTLYDTKLQNIFSDYEASKATLAKAEQQSLQDAYFIREMSLKYLGEYASNTGMGDVNGSLMDIHSDYARQRQEIAATKTGYELELDSAYREGLESLESLRFEYEEGVRGEKAQKVATWLELGDYGYREDGSRITDPREYLDRELAAGNIDQEQYNDLLRVAQYMEYAQQREAFFEDLEIGNFGKYTDESGDEQYKSAPDFITEAYDSGLISKTEYDRLIKTFDWYADIQDWQEFDIVDFTSPYLPDGKPNPNFIQGFDMTYFTDNKRFDNNSILLQIEGVEFISEKDSVDKMGYITSEELTDYFDETNPEDILAHGRPMYYKGEYYIYLQGNEGGSGVWHRLSQQLNTGYKRFIDTVNNEEEGVSKWVATDKKPTFSSSVKMEFGNGNVKINFGTNAASIEVNGIRYQSAKSKGQVKDQNVSQEFEKVHGDKNNAIVYYKGKLYHKANNGKIYVMNKVTA